MFVAYGGTDDGTCQPSWFRCYDVFAVCSSARARHRVIGVMAGGEPLGMLLLVLSRRRLALACRQLLHHRCA